MLSLPPSIRIFLCAEVADMRRGFDGLAAMTHEIVGEDPMSGHLFVFRNRRRDRVKILYWDRDGYALWYKRLEKGTFRFPSVTSRRSRRIEVKASDLMMLLDGVDLMSVRRQRRYARHTCACVK
jgi:transposase